MSTYAELRARAAADPRVLGLVLTGSQARGVPGPHSDHDVGVVVADPAHWGPPQRTSELDVFVCTPSTLADTSDRDQRYAFRGAQVLLDRLDGQVVELVRAQATPTPAEAARWSRGGLSAYLNLVHRAAKSHRDGAPTPARLDERESVPWLLLTLFAMHGRLRPYNKYLRWELSTYPLGVPWDAATLPERLTTHPAGLLPDLEELARRTGHGDVVDGWGDDLQLMRWYGSTEHSAG